MQAIWLIFIYRIKKHQVLYHLLFLIYHIRKILLIISQNVRIKLINICLLILIFQSYNIKMLRFFLYRY